jgi:hypothetical protein
MATIVYIGAYEPKDDNEIPDDTNPAWRIHQGATDYLVADTTDGSEAVRLVGSGTGKVGLGSGFTTPQELLHIANPGSGASDNAYIKFTTGDSGHGETEGAWLGYSAADNFLFQTDQRSMYFDSTGGTGYTPFFMDSVGTIRYWYAPYFVAGIYINAVDSGKKIDDSSNGGSSTTLYIGNESITTSSDRRLKKNIVDTSANALETLDKVRVVDFEWDDPSDTSWNGKNARGVWTGVIAQEIIDYIPYSVNAPRDPKTMEALPEAKKLDENGNEIDELWFMNHGDIVPLLIKAVQELKSEIAQLKEGN